MPVKRALEAVTESSMKRPKVDKSTLPVVLEVIDSVADQRGYQDGTRLVLREMAKASLAEASGEFHSFQMVALRKVAETIEWQCNTLSDCVVKATDKVLDVVQEEADLQTNKTPADEKLQQRSAQVGDAKSALALATQQVIDTKNDVWETDVKNSRDDAGLRAIREERAELDACLSDNLEVVRNGRIEKTSYHLSVLLQVGEKINLDDSLMTVLPNACTRAPEERSAFSRISIDQFSQLVNEKIAGLQSLIDAAGPAATERSAARDLARSKADEAKAALLQAASDFRNARTAETDGLNVVEDIAARQKVIGQKHAAANKARAEQQQKLHIFETCFESFLPSKKEDTGSADGTRRVNDKVVEHVTIVEAVALGGQ